LFLSEYEQAYTELRSDPAAWAEMEVEGREWDATLMDGMTALQDEELHASPNESVRKTVGSAASQAENIEADVLTRLRDRRRRKVYASYRAASEDPAYVEEMESLAASFDRSLGARTTDTDR
jgi:hypothetical protein